MVPATKMSGNPLWMRVPDAVHQELDELRAGWGAEDIPRSRVLLAAVRAGLAVLQGLTPTEVYGLSQVGMRDFQVTVARRNPLK